MAHKSTKKRSPRLADKRVIYIGARSSEERKQLFAQIFGVDYRSPAHDEPMQRLLKSDDNAHAAIHEDPYRPETWPRGNMLHSLNNRSARDDALLAKWSQMFYERYNATRIVPKQSSATQPELFTAGSIHHIFRRVLTGRDDLFLKLTNLAPDADGDELQAIQAYNEVRVGFFLNELVYNYSHVASLHFMTVLDWFPAPARFLLGDRTATYLHQAMITERMDISLRDYLLKEVAGDIRVLRAILFQVFHALETAWRTHAFVHHDLHDNNVMLRSFAAEKTHPLYNKDFLYKRVGLGGWYRVPRKQLRNHVVKIIDFGRARLMAPTEPDHLREQMQRANHYRHVHDQLICAEGFHWLGHGCADPPNRSLDVMLLLLWILHMPVDTYWSRAKLRGQEQELTEFYGMCDQLLDFDEMTSLAQKFAKFRSASDMEALAAKAQTDEQRDQLLDLASKLRQAHLDPPALKRELEAAGGVLSAETYAACPQAHRLMRMTGVFVYKERTAEVVLGMDEALTPTRILNHPFFGEFFTAEQTPARDLTEDEIVNERASSVVVAFIPHASEADFLYGAAPWASPTPRTLVQTRLRCKACGQPCAEEYCSHGCYAFERVFDSRTIYR